MRGTCGLCLRSEALRVSHIIPRFIGKWLKDTSPTGRFRSPESPNKPVQDVLKHDLLCSACEQLIGGCENDFKKQVFDQWLARGRNPTVLMQGIRSEDPNVLGRFGLSLVLRAALFEQTTDKKMTEDQRRLLESAVSAWRPSVLGHGAVEEISLAIAQAPEIDLLLRHLGLKERRFRYCLRDLDLGSIFGSASMVAEASVQFAGVYVKIPGFAFVGINGLPKGSSLTEDQLRQLVGPRIQASHGAAEHLEEQLSARQRQLGLEVFAREVASTSLAIGTHCAMLDEYQKATGIWIDATSR